MCPSACGAHVRAHAHPRAHMRSLGDILSLRLGPVAPQAPALPKREVCRVRLEREKSQSRATVPPPRSGTSQESSASPTARPHTERHLWEHASWACLLPAVRGGRRARVGLALGCVRGGQSSGPAAGGKLAHLYPGLDFHVSKPRAPVGIKSPLCVRTKSCSYSQEGTLCPLSSPPAPLLPSLNHLCFWLQVTGHANPPGKPFLPLPCLPVPRNACHLTPARHGDSSAPVPRSPGLHSKDAGRVAAGRTAGHGHIRLPLPLNTEFIFFLSLFFAPQAREPWTPTSGHSIHLCPQLCLWGLSRPVCQRRCQLAPRLALSPWLLSARFVPSVTPVPSDVRCSL